MQPVHLMRPRLNDRFSRAAAYPITLVIAPAGFGKSVALRDFLRDSRTDVVRIDVRREDDTLLGFSRHFCDAVAAVAPSAAASFASLQEKLLSADDPSRLVCDWFAEHLKRTIGTIVVDDLHFAAIDPASIAFLTGLIDRTLERIHWIVASRSDANLPIATWLAYGRMDLPIDGSDLRFTLEEAMAAAQAAHAPIETAEVKALCELTEGWPVALAIALRTQTQAADLRAATTRDLIYRYLAEQVFTRLPPSQREFLLATSVFSTFDAAIAEALGGTAGSIDELRRGVAFLTESDVAQYRYHDLFRDYLESELFRRGVNAWREAVVTGARLLEEKGDLAPALSLYAKAKDGVSILRLTETYGFALFERGQADALSAALDALPEELRRESPAALGLQAALEAARGHFEPACRGFVAAIERAGRIELRLALVHRYAIELVRHGRDCIGLLEHYALDDRMPSPSRLPLLGTLATAYGHAGRSAEAIATIERALELLDPTAGDEIRARLFQQAAHVYVEHGDREQGRRYAGLAVELARSHNLYDVAVRAYSVLYTIAYDGTDDPIACLAILDKLLEAARQGASVQGRLYGLMASYGIEVDRGNEEAVERIESALESAPGTLPQSRSEVLLPAMALRAAWRGDFRHAHELLAQAQEHQSDERVAERFSELALYACAAGTPDDEAEKKAYDALARWNKPTRRAMRSRLMLAFCELARGRTALAHRQLAVVSRHVDPTMTRLDALYHTASALYRTVLGQGDPEALAGTLERLRAEQFGGIARLLEAIPFPRLHAGGGYASLSATEREILQLLVAGGSTKEMAARSSRSPRTIEAHVRSICKKLSCKTRRAAVTLAIVSGWVQNEG
jgi:ATP/maltotriose-dependent transcriptional regulator MalT